VKFQHQVLRVLPVITLACSLLSAPAEAQFTQQAKLVGTGVIDDVAFQGYSVSISADGNTALVGGPADNGFIGAAWIFTRSTSGMWSQQGPKLVGTDAVGPFGGPGQGVSVSLSGDGNTAIIGGAEDNGFIGAAWIFTRSTSGMWSQQGPKLVGTGAVGPVAEPGQGYSVSLSEDGNTALVSGPSDNNAFGATWVFTRSGGVWGQQAKLVANDAIGRAGQGEAVSLSGDGNIAIIGGGGDDGGVGAAWIFTRAGGIWSQQAKLIGAGAIGRSFQGQAVSLSADGNAAIIGGPGDNPTAPQDQDPVGAAWVFAVSGGVWNQQAKLVGTGVIGSFQVQGFSVSLSGDGNIAIIGGPFDNPQSPSGVNPIGAAWVFMRSGGVWNQQEKLVGTGVIDGVALQGNSVSISGDGRTVIVGGPVDNGGVGAAWVFAQPVFAGTPGKANCHGQSVSALARQYGGLNSAAAALGYADVSALQNAILAFCGS
jgi:hypothetical protein